MQEGLKSLGYDIGVSATPVIPVVTGQPIETWLLWKSLFDGGIFTNPVIPPAVPDHSCRVRISMMATHTDKQIDFVLDAFDRGRHHLGIRSQVAV
jgi:7-keto-8-aminopelargonate synthetase-like enzyme